MYTDTLHIKNQTIPIHQKKTNRYDFVSIRRPELIGAACVSVKHTEGGGGGGGEEMEECKTRLLRKNMGNAILQYIIYTKYIYIKRRNFRYDIPTQIVPVYRKGYLGMPPAGNAKN